MRTKKQGRNPIDLNVRFGMITPQQRPGPLSGVAAVLLFLGGVLVWFVLFSLKGELSRQILTIEIVVNVILLAVNIYAICRIGYDGFVKNGLVTWSLNVILAMAGFYLTGLKMLKISAAGMEWLTDFMEFMVFLLLASLMSLVPTLLICLVMWLVMAVFGE